MDNKKDLVSLVNLKAPKGAFFYNKNRTNLNWCGYIMSLVSLVNRKACIGALCILFTTIIQLLF